MFPILILGQAIPSDSENIENLITFSKDAPSQWGDDDNVQTFFAFIPFDYNEPFYIRIFDPNVGGFLDAAYGDKVFDSSTQFSIYGGEGAHSDPDAQGIDPVGNYKSGTLLDYKVFSDEKKYDMQWVTFGPFNPIEGEYDKSLNGYIFKIIAEGLEGNDGNLYSYYLSRHDNLNKPIDGANAFTYEYTFRLKSKGNIAHVYPFIDENVIAIKQFNFDLDADGDIKLYSVSKNGEDAKVSGDNSWDSSSHTVTEEEKFKCVDLQILRKVNTKNDVSLYVLNQYDEAIRFFSSPLGSHKYVYQFSVTPKEKE